VLRTKVHWAHSWFWEVKEINVAADMDTIEEDAWERVPLLESLEEDLAGISTRVLQLVPGARRQEDSRNSMTGRRINWQRPNEERPKEESVQQSVMKRAGTMFKRVGTTRFLPRSQDGSNDVSSEYLARGSNSDKELQPSVSEQSLRRMQSRFVYMGFSNGSFGAAAPSVDVSMSNASMVSAEPSEFRMLPSCEIRAELGARVIADMHLEATLSFVFEVRVCHPLLCIASPANRWLPFPPRASCRCSRPTSCARTRTPASRSSVGCSSRSSSATSTPSATR
jgi:hypothetical protein